MFMVMKEHVAQCNSEAPLCVFNCIVMMSETYNSACTNVNGQVNAV